MTIYSSYSRFERHEPVLNLSVQPAAHTHVTDTKFPLEFISAPSVPGVELLMA